MKKTLIILFLLSVSCANDKEHINVAEKFSKNLLSGQINKAKEFTTESTAKQIEMSVGLFGQKVVKPNFEFEFIKDSISQNEAWVKFKNMDDNKEDKLYLMKIDNKCLVHFDKKKQKLFN